jgi:hypothetical protein
MTWSKPGQTVKQNQKANGDEADTKCSTLKVVKFVRLVCKTQKATPEQRCNVGMIRGD